MKEIWKDIIGYEGYYQVSSIGRIKSCDRVIRKKNRHGSISECTLAGKVIKAFPCSSGYFKVSLSKHGVLKNVMIHRLVALHFITNKENKSVVNHKDCNKINNNVSNLEWATSSENTIHAVINGTHTSGKSNSRSKVVLQKDISGEILNRFYGTREAARETGLHQSSISACCTGKSKTAGGYIFEFIK